MNFEEIELLLTLNTLLKNGFKELEQIGFIKPYDKQKNKK